MKLLTSEPVRVRVYSVLVAVLALLVWRGIVSSEESLLWLAIASAILGILGVESARAKVTPVAEPTVVEGTIVTVTDQNGVDTGHRAYL